MTKKNLFSWFLKQNCAKFVCVIISSPLWYKNVDFSFYYRQYVVVVPKLNSKRKFGYPRAAVELFSGFLFLRARDNSESYIRMQHLPPWQQFIVLMLGWGLSRRSFCKRNKKNIR